MARKCKITGKGVMVGNNVSHANNKTKRRFMPNLQEASFFSDALNQRVKLRLSTRAMRTIEHNGGIDAYVAKTAITKLPAELKGLKKRLDTLASA